jgi:hypothetical protein
MTITAQRALVPTLALIALALTSPHVLAGQSLSARPASVALTVVVPPHAQPEVALVTDNVATNVRRTPAALDLETTVGLGNRIASRVEVRLGMPWTVDSARVWVQNRHGAFEQLVSSTSIVTLDTPPLLAGPRSPLRFRIESNQPSLAASMAIPVEYRLTVGTGDAIAVWTFPALLKFEPTR